MRMYVKILVSQHCVIDYAAARSFFYIIKKDLVIKHKVNLT